MVRPLKYVSREDRAAYDQARKKDRHRIKTCRNKPDYIRPDRLDKFSHSEFVAWDGEGLNVVLPGMQETSHVYALLMNSVGDIKQDVKGLSTIDCLELLLKGASIHSN